jgi:hypothetical protein
VGWSRRASLGQRLASVRDGRRLFLSAGIACIGEIVSRRQGLVAMLSFAWDMPCGHRLAAGVVEELDATSVIATVNDGRCRYSRLTEDAHRARLRAFCPTQPEETVP